MEGRGDRDHVVWLGKESLVIRRSYVSRVDVSGRHDHPDRGPPITHRSGQFEPIHRARHIDVGKEQANRGVCLQKRDRNVRSCRLEHREPGLFEFFDHADTDENFVLDDEDRVPARFQWRLPIVVAGVQSNPTLPTQPGWGHQGSSIRSVSCSLGRSHPSPAPERVDRWRGEVTL